MNWNDLDKLESQIENVMGEWILVDHGNIAHWVDGTAKLVCGLKYKSFRCENYSKGDGGICCKNCFDTFDEETKKLILENGITLKIQNNSSGKVQCR